MSIGDGIYKSTDGGENWTNVGLKDSERIAKILVDPENGDTVYACATGHLWDDNDERGVYKTTDGGKTWRKVLAGANGSTGCAHARHEPRRIPTTLYASHVGLPPPGAGRSARGGPGQRHSSNPPTAASTGPSSPPPMPRACPTKPYGRIALAVAPSKPQVVYAMIESAKSALFRSDDGGANWTRARRQPVHGLAAVLLRAT